LKDRRKALFHGHSSTAGAQAFVYISAAGIIMDDAGTPIHNADESAPTFPNHFSAYLASKARAEPLVLTANKPSFRTIALRPPAIWGLPPRRNRRRRALTNWRRSR
jgi:nucleoside-diphosphate-sugar epimerase